MTEDAATFSRRGLPLLFRTPPGWAQPSDEWMALNQGWRPSGSDELSRYPPVPSGWSFWVQNEPVWGQLVAEARRKNRTGMLIYGLVAVAGFVVSAGLHLIASESGGTTIVFWGAVLFGVLGFFRSASRYRRAEREAYVYAVMWSRRLRGEAVG